MAGKNKYRTGLRDEVAQEMRRRPGEHRTVQDVAEALHAQSSSVSHALDWLARRPADTLISAVPGYAVRRFTYEAGPGVEDELNGADHETEIAKAREEEAGYAALAASNAAEASAESPWTGENWGPAEVIIDLVWSQWAADEQDGLAGLSLPRRMVIALRRAGMLSGEDL